MITTAFTCTGHAIIFLRFSFGFGPWTCCDYYFAMRIFIRDSILECDMFLFYCIFIVHHILTICFNISNTLQHTTYLLCCLYQAHLEWLSPLDNYT